MFYLPRICEHCLNPSCVASCPSGAMYKREEDGIVLVDQDRCRGWRFCVSGCPYKKVYFNHRTGKAEKCTFCFPRIEAGQPTICSETCVGRLRYLGLILYDADKVLGAAATPGERDLYQAQLDVFLDPHDPGVQAAAERGGHPARLDRGRAALARVRTGRAAPGCAATAPGVPHPPDGLVHPAAVTGGRRRRWLRARPRLRRRRLAAHPRGVPGQPVHGRGHRAHPGGAAQARRRARRPAGRPARPGPGRGPARLGRVHAGRSRRPVPAARDRQVRAAVRHPARARRGSRAADGPARAAVLQPGHRREGPAWAAPGPHGIQAWRPAGAPGQDHTFRAGDGRTRFNLLGWDGRGDAPHLFPERGGS